MQHFGNFVVFKMCYTNKVDWIGLETHLVFGATLSISDVLSDNSLHLLSEHRILSQLQTGNTEVTQAGNTL